MPGRGEMVVCLSCRTVVWAYDHEPQDIRAIANHLKLPCPICSEIGNFDGYRPGNWQDMHRLAAAEGFKWQPDGECRWFDARTQLMGAVPDLLEALASCLDSLIFISNELQGDGRWKMWSHPAHSVLQAERALAKAKEQAR
jgi:hypothetical protein